MMKNTKGEQGPLYMVTRETPTGRNNRLHATIAATKFVAEAGAGAGEVVARALVFFRTKHWLNAVAAFSILSGIANHTTCWVAHQHSTWGEM